MLFKEWFKNRPKMQSLKKINFWILITSGISLFVMASFFFKKTKDFETPRLENEKIAFFTDPMSCIHACWLVDLSNVKMYFHSNFDSSLITPRIFNTSLNIKSRKKMFKNFETEKVFNWKNKSNSHKQESTYETSFKYDKEKGYTKGFKEMKTFRFNGNKKINIKIEGNNHGDTKTTVQATGTW